MHTYRFDTLPETTNATAEDDGNVKLATADGSVTFPAKDADSIIRIVRAAARKAQKTETGSATVLKPRKPRTPKKSGK